MSTSKSFDEQGMSYALHRRARHDRNLAVHALASQLTYMFTTRLRAFARRSGRLALRLANEWYRRRAIRALHRLDDRILGDIGLSRGDIEFVVRNGPPWRALQQPSGGVRQAEMS
jgi:uncharacterized protein YjiS (DUF1127 family)